MDNKQKCISLIAILLALIAYSAASSISSTNQTVGLNIIVNNTNLAPTIEPSVPGTGERVTGNTYYNNNSDIEIFLYAHASAVSQTSDIQLIINGTLVSSVSSKPVGASPEQNNKSIVAIIPRYSSYSANFTNYHHYEWREYQILSGNGSGSTSCINCVNETQLNLKVNKSGDLMTGDLNFGDHNITHVSSISDSLYLEIFSTGFGNISGTTYDTLVENETTLYYNNNKIVINKTGTTINNELSMSNENITNLGQIINVFGDINNSFDMSNSTMTWESTNATSTGTIQLDNSLITMYVNNAGNAGISINETDVSIDAKLDMTSHNIINCANCGNGYYRDFWPRQGTVVSGTWSWVSSASQTDYQSVHFDTAGFWVSNGANNSEYKYVAYLPTGQYIINISHIKNIDEGIAELLIDSTSIGTQDMYNNPATFNNLWTVNFNITTQGRKDIRFKATGKNAGSANYAVNFARYQIEKIGEI